jgi:hypothetical protein
MENKLYSHYQNGLRSKVRKSRFDSVSEGKICLILNDIMGDYKLYELLDLRLTPQQALDNYVEVTDSKYKRALDNRHKRMKFDFIFERVFKRKGRMNYVPVCVVEYDGPHHDEERQKEIDFYKNGIANNIGAELVRINYKDFENFEQESVERLRKKYEDEIIKAIIKGLFTKSSNYRKREALINPSNEKYFSFIVDKYSKELERLYRKKSSAKDEKEMEKIKSSMDAISNMLILLQFSKDHVYVSPNIY